MTSDMRRHKKRLS